MNKCEMCSNELKSDQDKFCSQICKNKFFNSKYQNYSVQKDRGINRKLYFINKKGGCCEVCGYKQNIAGLVFHHIDPNTKEFELDGRTLANGKMQKLEIEAAKCQLLCQLCHIHHHHPQLDMSHFDNHEIIVKSYNVAEPLINLSEDDINKIIYSINSTSLNKTALWLNVDPETLSRYLTKNNLRNRITFSRQTKISWPKDEDLLKMLVGSNYSAVSRILGVSPAAIKKRLKSRNLI